MIARRKHQKRHKLKEKRKCATITRTATPGLLICEPVYCDVGLRRRCVRRRPVAGALTHRKIAFHIVVIASRKTNDTFNDAFLAKL